MKFDEALESRARKIMDMGFKPFDSYHIAAAERSADVFLTTDGKLLKRSRRTELKVRVENRLNWLIEIGEENDSDHE
mgnify:CR=1 FL=1